MKLTNQQNEFKKKSNVNSLEVVDYYLNLNDSSVDEAIKSWEDDKAVTKCEIMNYLKAIEDGVDCEIKIKYEMLEYSDDKEKKGENIVLGGLIPISKEEVKKCYEDNAFQIESFKNLINSKFCEIYDFPEFDYHVSSCKFDRIKNFSEDHQPNIQDIISSLNSKTKEGLITALIFQKRYPNVENFLERWKNQNEKEVIYENKKKMEVCFVGNISTGKSSLINTFLGNRICPHNVTRCTTGITFHSYTKKELKKKDIRNIKKEIQRSNTNAKLTKIQKFESFNNKEFENFVFIDTPGLDDGDKKIEKDEIFDENFKKIVRQSDVIVYLVSPDGIKAKKAKNSLDKIVELNSNIIICFTMADKIIDQIKEDLEEEIDEINDEEVISKFLWEWHHNFQKEFPSYLVCFSQVKEKKNGLYFFNTGMLNLALKKFAIPGENTYLWLKNHLFNDMKKKNILPFGRYRSFRKKERRKITLACAVVGGVVAVPALVIAGGVVILTGTYLGALSGFSLGAVAITSFLADLGIGAISVGTIGMVGTIGVVGDGILDKIGSADSIGIGTSAYIKKLPKQTQIFTEAMMGEYKKSCQITIRPVSEKEKKKLVKEIKANNGKKFGKKFLKKEDIENCAYEDCSIVNFQGEIYIVNAKFKRGLLLSIIDFMKIEGEKKIDK